MSYGRTPKCDRVIEGVMRECCTLPWKIDYGPKHKKLYIDGQMVQVWSHGANARLDEKALKRTIKKAIADAHSKRTIRGTEKERLQGHPHGRAVGVPHPV